ncbi:MAG: 3-dehydroquinate synthase [Ignavibacteriota bacterium]
MAKQIKVNLKDKSYPIIIGDNSLAKAIETINKSSVSKCLLIIDKNVLKYHSMLIRKTFALLNCKVYTYTFSATEKNKSLAQTEKIYKFLIENSFDRNSIIVAVGGGITGDIASFAASTYMRGIKLIQVPTTLLSMVDSSVGGKTGVNFNQQKNNIGSFYQPKFVAIYHEFLSTLPKRELYSAAGEIFKYSFLADEKNYSLLKRNLYKLFSRQSFDIDKIIFACLKIKTSIVENDEKETTGLRKILNLGHTFAHAFEVQSNYKLKHGEAVICGIYCALFLSESLGYLSKERLNKFLKDLAFIKPKKDLLVLNSNIVFQLMSTDKKNSMGKIKFVLIEEIGSIVVDATAQKSLVLDSIERMKKLI